MHIKLGPGALSAFTYKNPCKQPRSSVSKISKLILFKGFQLVGHFKTKKTSEYNMIIILDQKSYPIFSKSHFEFKHKIYCERKIKTINGLYIYMKSSF